VAVVVVTPTAVNDLERLALTLSLPATTNARIQASLASLETFPEIGSPLTGPWSEFRFILGPWRWMLTVYTYDPAADRVAVVTIQDARSAEAATSD
jgi:hypothetical protein